jgi:hypothetical protein
VPERQVVDEVDCVGPVVGMDGRNITVVDPLEMSHRHLERSQVRVNWLPVGVHRSRRYEGSLFADRAKGLSVPAIRRRELWSVWANGSSNSFIRSMVVSS